MIDFTKKQWRVLNNANKRWNILYGATRSGKTTVTFPLALHHISEHLQDNILFSGKTLNTIERNVFGEMRKLFGEEHIGTIVNNREITIFGKKCFVVGANDDRAITKIQGMGIGYAYCDELTTYPENFFQMLKSRLDKANACCDATCNPESPSHFVKQFLDNPNVQESIYSEQFTLYDNTFLAPDFVQALENEYRGTIYFDKWILGKWVKAEGLVFPLFKRERHFLTPDEYAKRYGSNRIAFVIFGADGANTNDATAIEPLAIFENGQAARLEHFYHNPKKNGQLSNELLIPYIKQYFRDLERKYHFRENGTQLIGVCDCAAADLCLSLSYHFPEYNFQKYTKKDILQTTDIVNNAFSRDAIHVIDFGGAYNYVRAQFEPGLDQLVVDLELMTWDERNEKYDPAVPNDCADAFRYAACTYFNNLDNLWSLTGQRGAWK